jgi:hypothetical protein
MKQSPNDYHGNMQSSQMAVMSSNPLKPTESPGTVSCLICLSALEKTNLGVLSWLGSIYPADKDALGSKNPN